MPGYNPYIIFNTGFQKDNPEIPQEIFNNYKVDKYLVKPLWENLRNHLAAYLKEAEEKIQAAAAKNNLIWLEDDTGAKVQAPLNKLICICQHPAEPRCRIFLLFAAASVNQRALQWHKCYELLDTGGINYFITKTRSHLVIKTNIEKFDKPFVRLKNFPAKIEVVKENLREFEQWLMADR